MEGLSFAAAESIIRRSDRLAEMLAEQFPEGLSEEFPNAALAALGEAGLLKGPLPVTQGGLGIGTALGTTGSLLRVLSAVGRLDLSLGRLYEGHCNALQLVSLFGTRHQQERVATLVREGCVFGIWNTDASGEPVQLVPHAGKYRLRGRKIFCSGAGVIRPIITATDASGGRQMVLLSDTIDHRRVDISQWKPLGMVGSASGAVDFDGVTLDEEALLGRPDDYLREPWFRGGSIRFAAVQLGGAEALLRLTVAQLRRSNRQDDPAQRARVGRLGIAVGSGRGWIERAGHAVDRFRERGADGRAASDAMVVTAHMMRLAIEAICRDAIELASRSIGLVGFAAPGRMERTVRDLTTYLCQPAPDAALDAVGARLLEDTDFTLDFADVRS